MYEPRLLFPRALFAVCMLAVSLAACGTQEQTSRAGASDQRSGDPTGLGQQGRSGADVDTQARDPGGVGVGVQTGDAAGSNGNDRQTGGSANADAGRSETDDVSQRMDAGSPAQPGTEGDDDVPSNDGAADASTGGTTEVTHSATISIDDPVPGFASEAGGTTGGGSDLSGAITVSSMTELRSATSGSSPAIVLVQPGNYAGELSPAANKTIVGLGPGVKLTGNLKISGGDRSNIIVRNIAIQGERCSSYEACKAGADAVYVGNGAHHVWLDHLDVSDGQDGNCDITQGGDYVTVSWTYFHYTYDKEHRFSNLIAGSDDEPASVGKLHITYMNSHWGERVDQRQPRGRFGNIHMLNNYHNTGGSQIHGVGKDMALIAENSVYDESISIWKDMGSPRGWKGVGNIGTGRDLNDSRGTVFEVPYSYTPMPASQVVAAVTSPECGAGNTCELKQP